MINKLSVWEYALYQDNYLVYSFVDRWRKEDSEIIAAVTKNGRLILGNMFFNLSLKEQYFVLNHEALHIVLNSFERRKNRDAKIFNIAHDILINEMLIGIGLKIPKLGVTRKTFGVPQDLTTAEAVYDWLFDNKVQFVNIEFDLKDFDEDGEEAELSEADKKFIDDLKTEFKASKMHSKLVPFATDKIIPRTFGFEEMLLTKVGRAIKSTISKSYVRPSRIDFKDSLIRASYRKSVFVPKIDIYIDVSGSMSGKTEYIYAVLKNMKAKLKSYDPTYFAFDTSIETIDINSDNLPLGGGTNINNVFNNINKRHSDYSIVITDCDDSFNCDTLNKDALIVTDSKQQIKKGRFAEVFNAEFKYEEINGRKDI